MKEPAARWVFFVRAVGVVGGARAVLDKIWRIVDDADFWEKP